MERFRILPVFLLLAAFPLTLEAQPAQSPASPVASVDFRSVDRMSREDRALEARSDSTLRDRALAAGMDFNQGQWSEQQIVCPALPDHLFLQFTRGNGGGDRSEFSVSIPRGSPGPHGQVFIRGLGSLGRLRVLPIERRGYALFSPAPVNAQTIEAFNRIRAEEPVPAALDWSGTGLCFAALAGARAQVAPADVPSVPADGKAAPGNAGATLSYTDTTQPARPVYWTMSFDGAGKLLKVTRASAHDSNRKAIHPREPKPTQKTPAEPQGKLVKSTDPAAKATPIN